MPERASGVREFTERLPPDSPQARGARPLPRIPWQPVSWGGRTTYKTTHKTQRVYRPGQGVGHPAGHPLRPQRGLVRASFKATFDIAISGLESRYEVNHMCGQRQFQRTSSGLRRSVCFGSSISVDGNYSFPPLPHESHSMCAVEVVDAVRSTGSFDLPVVACQLPFPAADVVGRTSSHWNMVRSSTSCGVATRVPSSDARMEAQGRDSWFQRMARCDAVHLGHQPGSSHLAVTNLSQQCWKGVSLKTPFEGVPTLGQAGRSPRVLQHLFPHFKPLSSRES